MAASGCSCQLCGEIITGEVRQIWERPVAAYEEDFYTPLFSTTCTECYRKWYREQEEQQPTLRFSITLYAILFALFMVFVYFTRH